MVGGIRGTCRREKGVRVRHGRFVDVYPYQLAFGFTFRWFEHRPHFRLYLGPVKIHV